MPNVEHPERPRRGINAIRAPYSTVTKAFEGFQLQWRGQDFLSDVRRGGIRRDGNPRGEQLTDEPSPLYHVQSSFTEEQRAYVGASIACLNTIAQGRLFVPHDEPILTFAQRIENSLRNDPNLQEAAMKATFDIYTDFGRFYPNLTPALQALSLAGGILGTGMAFSDATHYAALERDGVISYQPDNSVRRFTHDHTFEAPSDPYEVWCSGEAFAKTIIRQTQEAAIHAREVEIPIVHLTHPEGTLNFSKNLLAHITAITENVRQQENEKLFSSQP